MKPKRKKYRLLHEDEVILSTDEFTYHYEGIASLRGDVWSVVGVVLKHQPGITRPGKTVKQCREDNPNGGSNYQIRREWKRLL